MLLYHFPLTSNSSTPNLENKGLLSDYTIKNTQSFVAGGKLSSYCAMDDNGATYLLVNNLQNEFSLSLRYCLPTNYTPENYGCIVLVNNLNIWWYNSSWYVNANNVSVKQINPIRNKWNDIIVTCKDSQISLYINGVLQHSFTASSTDGKCYIGLNKSNCLYQDIRIYDHVLSQQEIKDYSKALILHYPLNGSDLGNTIKDVSGFGNDYTKNASKSYTYLSNSPRYRKHINTNDENLKSVSTTSAIQTKSVWCKIGNDWYFLANNGSKYVNGVLSSQYDNILSNATELSDLRIYASALSESDIKALYNQPISLGNSLNAIEFSEPAKYKSFAWRTPTYDEMNYIINQRPNASNLRGLGRVNVNGTYVNGFLIMPDDFVAPEGVSFTPTTANYTTNSYDLEQFRKLESVCCVFLASFQSRNGVNFAGTRRRLWLGGSYALEYDINFVSITNFSSIAYYGLSVRLVRNSLQGKFSTSATTKIDFAPANLQYHCTKHIWRFAEHQYDYIGATNANISDTYNGWIDLFGYGTSGKNFSPTLHTTNNADYASADISGTQNDWGVNEIVEPQYLDYDNKFHKTGIIKANEISEKLVYPSKYWRTPTYDEMNYILNTRTNASNLKSLGRVLVNGSYKSGCFLLPDNYNIPEGITFVPNVFNATDLNSYNYEQFTIMNDGGVVFIPFAGGRNGANMITYWYFQGLLTVNSVNVYRVVIDYTNLGKGDYYQQNFAKSVRLVHSSQQGKFSTPTGNIDFAPANLQYHCTKHIWRFAEHQYDFIGSANANIADTYDGWIDLFGYGTSGVNYSPTLHSTNKSDYASADISGTQNDWGVNEIEYRETGFYKDKIRYNKIKEI